MPRTDRQDDDGILETTVHGQRPTPEVDPSRTAENADRGPGIIAVSGEPVRKPDVKASRAEARRQEIVGRVETLLDTFPPGGLSPCSTEALQSIRTKLEIGELMPAALAIGTFISAAISREVRAVRSIDYDMVATAISGMGTVIKSRVRDEINLTIEGACGRQMGRDELQWWGNLRDVFGRTTL